MLLGMGDSHKYSLYHHQLTCQNVYEIALHQALNFMWETQVMGEGRTPPRPPISLVSRPPCPISKRLSGTVASNSWSKRQTSFPLKKDVRDNEPRI